MTTGSLETENLSEVNEMRAPNDWQIKKCLVLSGSLLLAVWGLIGLGALGLNIPVLRQVVAFIFLSFVPGLLLLRIFRIHNVHIIESLLYSVGLSLAFLMAVGVLANFALPPLGISRPIALLPLLLIITFVFLLLCLFAYIRDKDFRPSSWSDSQTSESIWQSFRANPAPYLLAALLPLLSILGAALVNAYHNNILLFAFTFIIIIIIGLVAFNKFIPPRVYPFMIFMMGIALLYQTTLISSNLVGSDIHLEYYLGNLVVETGYWDATIRSPINSCLSVVMLAPVYSLLLNMDVIWLFKVIYPLLFALMPLALFRVFSLQIKPQYAFLAVVFFITMPMFIMDMAQLGRQQISELFFVLVILLMVDRNLTLIQRTALIIIFGFGVVVSHYGMGTGYIGYLIFGVLVLIFIKSRPGRTTWQWLVGKSHSLPADLTSAGAFNKKALAIIVGVSLVFMLGYYSVVASGAATSGSRVATNIALSTTEQIIQGITAQPPSETSPSEMPPSETPPSETPPPAEVPPVEVTQMIELPGFIQDIIVRFPMLNPLRKEPLIQTALGLDFSLASPGGKVWRIFQYLVELCTVIGFFRLIFRPGGLGNLKVEYISLTMVSALILFSIFILPTRSFGMGASRVWQVTLLLVSPLLLFGGELIVYGIVKLTRIIRRGFASSRLSLESLVPLQCLVLVVLIPYFIFNSGVVFELSRGQTIYFIDVPYSIALSSYRVDMTTTFTKQDANAANWLISNAGEDYAFYVDYHSKKLLGTQTELRKAERLVYIRKAREMAYLGYIYFRTWNTQKEALTFSTSYGARQSLSFVDLPWFMEALEKSDKIYDNNSAQILLCR
jgi:uncharacterized membrane protein